MDFQIGCNYWASHAGIYMWRNWDKNVVENDLRRLSQGGIRVLRVFPLWSDFQPLTYVRGNGYYEIRNGDTAIDRSTPEGLAGVDPVMIGRFEEFVLLAKQYHMELIVPLLTGWMSGRMFFPPAFEARNPISDYETIKWELRFVRYFVERFKSFDNIIAWEAGNETNVMSFADDGYKLGNYYVWLSNIAGTVRGIDPSRPFVAGIHGLTIHGDLGITIAETGEICDILTVHPYAQFVPHCYVDGYTTMRSKLHATTESILYSQISGKPCLCEEIGQLGNSLGCDETVAQYLRANLYALWTHGFPGLLWWCAFDQEHLPYPPYDWCACEQELGLFKSNGEPKCLVKELLDFQAFLSNQTPLPPYQQDVTCVLSKNQDTWAVAYATNLLCKQAGLDVRFVDGDDVLPDSTAYLLPSLTGDAVPKRTWNALMKKVEDGAVLYISWQDAILAGFENMTGMKVISNCMRQNTQVDITLPGTGMIRLRNERRLNLAVQDSEVIGTEADGNPAFICHTYGKGRIYFLTCPMEVILADQPKAFENTDYYKLYQQMFRDCTDRKVIDRSSVALTLTEHPTGQDRCTVIAMNYGPQQSYSLTVKDGWTLETVEYGKASQPAPGQITAEPEGNSICRFVLKKS